MGNHQLWPPPTIGWWLCVVFAFLISFLFCSWASLCLFYSTWDGWWPASSSFGQSVKSIFGIPCWHRGNSTLGWRCCCQSYRSRQHGKAMVCYLVTCPSVSEKVSKLTLLITCCYKCGLVSHISWPTRLGSCDFTRTSCWVIAFCQTGYTLHQFAILDDAGLVSFSVLPLDGGPSMFIRIRKSRDLSPGARFCVSPCFPKYQLAWALLAPRWLGNIHGKGLGGCARLDTLWYVYKAVGYRCRASRAVGSWPLCKVENVEIMKYTAVLCQFAGFFPPNDSFALLCTMIEWKWMLILF